MSELECEFVSTHGILKSCDEQILSIHEPNVAFRCMSLKKGDVLYVTGFTMKAFLKNIWKYVQEPIVVVTGNADDLFPNCLQTEPGMFESFLEDSRLVHWFCQNLIGFSHPKCTRIPIGLDYHTLAGHMGLLHYWGSGKTAFQQEEGLRNIQKNAVPWKDRAPLVFCNWHFFGDRGDRAEALSKIDSTIHFKVEKYIDRDQTWKMQSKVCFVSSPQGNGFDCHRTWEAILLGCVPIVKDTDTLFDGLPVWIVNDWSEVTAEAVLQKKEEFSSRLAEFASEKLFLKYWMSVIRSKVALCS